MTDDNDFSDKTIFLQVQQFLDEWNYRLLKSGLALTMDRPQTTLIALHMFEMNGVPMSDAEKNELSHMDDEDEMIERIVQKMPMSSRKTFEHFALQLQLVLSSTTRVHYSLEEGNYEEVAKVMEDGDTGVSQQILKQCVVEAGAQIHDLGRLRGGWLKNTESRIGRLARCQDDADQAENELAALTGKMRGFGSEQNAKSKKVLVSIAGNQDKNLLRAVFGVWHTHWYEVRNDKDIHDMFKKQVEAAETKLIDFKKKQLGNVRSVLLRKAEGGDMAMLQDSLRLWYRVVQEDKGDAELNERVKASKARLQNAKQNTTENAKKVMTRMTAGQEQALVSLCLQSWQNALEEMKKDKEMDRLVKEAEAQLKDHLKSKSSEARGVLDRMSGSSDTGLLHYILQGWIEVYRTEKKANDLNSIISGNNEKFKSLNLKQKGAARSMASKANRGEEENTLTLYFISWSTEAKLERIIKYQGSKLDHKKHQLDAVQTMFRSFANQLDQGIINTPRSQRSKLSLRGTESMPDFHARPPALPHGQAPP